MATLCGNEDPAQPKNKIKNKIIIMTKQPVAGSTKQEKQETLKDKD